MRKEKDKEKEKQKGKQKEKQKENQKEKDLNFPWLHPQRMPLAPACVPPAGWTPY